MNFSKEYIQRQKILGQIEATLSVTSYDKELYKKLIQSIDTKLQIKPNRALQLYKNILIDYNELCQELDAKNNQLLFQKGEF